MIRVEHRGSREPCSLLQSFTDKLEQRLRGRIVGQAEVGVNLCVVGLFGPKDRDGKARLFQDGAKPLCLRGIIGVIGDVEDQKRRNPFVLGNMCVRWPSNGEFRRGQDYAACAGACSASYWSGERYPSV